MKVGIITIIDQVNIGNRLQNYAAQELLKARGCQVSTLVYETYDEEGSKLYRVKAFFRNLLVRSGIFTSRFYLTHIKRSQKMFLVQEFNRTYMDLTKKYYFKTTRMAKHKDDFDYYCAGSDQIWNPALVQSRDFFFMGFAPSERTFSLSASMGMSGISEKYLDNFRKGFTHVGSISVRENSVRELISKIVGRDTTVLLDPTLLVDRSKWLSIARKPAIDLPDRYIATYFLSELTPAQKSFIEDYARKQDLSVIDMNQTYYQQVGPLEYLYLIANAQFVFTDSFHGTAFSIIFDKDFLVFQRNYMYDMSSRITTVLEKVKLENRFYCGSNDQLDASLRECVEEIRKQDTSHVGPVLEQEKQKADAFFQGVFKGKDQP